MESTHVFARIETVTAVVTVVCMFIDGSFSMASGQGIDRCDHTSVKECYISYKEAIWWNEFKPSPEGVYDEEEFKRGCSRFKDKLQCDDDQANCTDVINGAYSIQERGYEAMRDIICDSKTVKDFHIAFKCRDDTKLIECVQNLKPAPGPQNRGVPTTGLDYCRLLPIEIACFEQMFNSSCPLEMKTAKAVITRVIDVIALLAGCPSSTHAVATSRGLYILLYASVILSWHRASRMD